MGQFNASPLPSDDRSPNRPTSLTRNVAEPLRQLNVHLLAGFLHVEARLDVVKDRLDAADKHARRTFPRQVGRTPSADRDYATSESTGNPVRPGTPFICRALTR